MKTGCSDVCERVSELICEICPKKMDCLHNDEIDESDYHEKLIECLTDFAENKIYTKVRHLR